MMMMDLKLKMTTSISEVLETMFYMALEFEEFEDIQNCNLNNEGELSICKLDFTGNLTGHFIIFVPEDLLTSMTADFMGEDKDDITKDFTDGTIKEIVNMVGGNMFAALNNEAEFRLGIPEMIENKNFLQSIINNPPEGLVIAEAIEGHLGFIIYAG